MNTLPPPSPAEQPSKRRKWPWIAGGSLMAVIFAGALLAPAEPPVDEPEAEAVATTEAPVETTVAPTTAPPTTQAPTTTRAPAPPPQPEPSLADLVGELWEETSYCYTDCSNLHDAQEWIDRAEWYGRIDADDFVYAYQETDRLPIPELDTLCDGFWALDDDEIANIAIDSGVDPAAFVLNLYVWCDS